MGKIKEVDRKARAGEPLTAAETDLMIGKIIEDQQKIQLEEDTSKGRRQGFNLGVAVGATVVATINILMYILLGGF